MRPRPRLDPRTVIRPRAAVVSAICLCGIGLISGGCRPLARSPVPTPAAVKETVYPRSEAFRGIDRLLDRAVLSRAFPGGVLLIGARDGIVHVHAFGRLSYEIDSPRVTPRTIYDLASLTKVVATTALAMVLTEDGRLDLDAPVGAFLPAFSGGDKEKVKVRDLLRHTSGLPAWVGYYRELRGKEAMIKGVVETELEYPPGTKSVYSDLGMILLGAILERVSGEALDVAVKRRVFDPLSMRETCFLPGRELLVRIAPTEYSSWRGQVLHGEVHDDNAYVMGGVSGHAGLFGTAPDLGRFAEMMLRGGEPLVSETTLRAFTVRSEVLGSSRALGWDTPGGDEHLGQGWSEDSFGHSGLTGTFLWIDRGLGFYLVLLTNRIHPTRENDSWSDVRRAVSEAVLREWVRQKREKDEP